jgi:hypothetical protein
LSQRPGYRSPRARALQCGSQLGNISLQAFKDCPRIFLAFDVLEIYGASLAQRSLNGTPDPGADGHPVGRRDRLHLLDRLGGEPDGDVLGQRSRSTSTRRAGRGLAVRGIVVVLEGVGVGHCRASL